MESRPPDDRRRHDEVRSLYEQERRTLWRALLAWSGSQDVAEEAVAEAFAQLLRRGQGVLDPKAWIWRTAFKVAAGDLQRRRARPASSLENVEVAAPAVALPGDVLDLLAALGPLSEQQRACVALVYVADRSATDAARVLGTSAATVRVQLMRARRSLRTTLTEAAEADSEEHDR